MIARYCTECLKDWETELSLWNGHNPCLNPNTQNTESNVGTTSRCVHTFDGPEERQQYPCFWAVPCFEGVAEALRVSVVTYDNRLNRLQGLNELSDHQWQGNLGNFTRCQKTDSWSRRQPIHSTTVPKKSAFHRYPTCKNGRTEVANTELTGDLAKYSRM